MGESVIIRLRWGRVQGRREGGLDAYQYLARRLIVLKFGPLALEAMAELHSLEVTTPNVIVPPCSRREPATRDARTITAIIDSLVEDLLEEGRQEGRVQGAQDGLQEGRKEGRLAGFRAFTRVLVESRFGTLAPAVVAQIDSADERMLEDYIERLITATQVEQVLA